MKFSSHISQIVLVLILCMGFISPVPAQETEKLYQKGLVKEEGEGSLQEAIDIYMQVVDDASADRSLRAQALLHVGICYEKLGQEKAKASYEKLISEFADQGEVVAIGKKKLARLSSEVPVSKTRELTITQVWAPSQDTYGVSSDGRYLNYIDWIKIELAIKDLTSGDTRLLTNRGTWKPPKQFPDRSIWSPDNKQLAYFWYNDRSTELRILDIDGSGDRLIKKGKGLQTPWPISWSPDGEYILALGKLPGDTATDEKIGHLIRVSVEDGTVHLLHELEHHQAEIYGDISPDSKYIVFPLPSEEDSKNSDIYILSADGSTKELIVKSPAHDTDPVWKPDGKGIVFRSDRIGRESLWEQGVLDGRAAGKPKLLKANLNDQTSLLGFTRDESLFYSVKNFRTDVFIARIDFLTGEILSEPVKITRTEELRNEKAVWSPDGRYVLYSSFAKNHDPFKGRKQDLLIYDTQSQRTRKLDTEIWAKGGLYWTQPRWSPDGKSILIDYRAVKDNLHGFFLIDVASGEHRPVLVEALEPINQSSIVGSFPTFSKDGASIFYLSSNKKNILQMNLSTKEETEIMAGEDQIVQLSLSPDGSQIIYGYWFRDKQLLYSVPTKGGSPSVYMSLEEKSTPYVFGWASEELMLFTSNTSDDNLENDKIWRFKTNNSPEQVIYIKDILQRSLIRDMDMHPDGQHILISAMIGQGQEIWKMENLLSNNK